MKASLFRRLLKTVVPYRLPFILAIIGNLIYSGVDALFAYAIKPLLDKGFVNPDLDFIHLLPYLIVFLFILRAGGNFMSKYGMNWVGRSVIADFRKKIFKKLLYLPSRYYDQHASGQMLSKVVFNTSQVAEACTTAVTTVFQSGGLVIGLLVVMFINSWRLTLFVMIIVPFIYIVIRFASLRMRRISSYIQESMGDVTRVAQENIENYRVVRMFQGREDEIKRFGKVVDDNKRMELKLIVTRTLSVSTTQIIAAIALGTVILWATLPGHEDLSAGGFISMVVALIAMLNPLKQLANVNGKIQRGLAGAESLFGFIDEAEEENNGLKRLSRAKGAIEFNNVVFQYNDSPVLKGVSFKIDPGQTVALVGHSGSGKSTIVSLLPRFYQSYHGTITVDEEEIINYDLDDLRNQIAVVSQDIKLFNDTIENNIAYGSNQKKTKEETYHAAKMAHVLEFVEKLPEGMNTVIGESGMLLSGGQRQRLAIARALLKDSPILILDEATSSLDTESEKIIQSALKELMKNRTTIVIAHRLSTVEQADNIIVLGDGRVLESGRHDALLKQEGAYSRLYDLQFQEPAG